MTLREFFEEHGSVAVALSGGVDSAWLLHEAVRYAHRVEAYYVGTPLQKEQELRDARATAAAMGVPLHELWVDVLALPEVESNPSDRCYYCKKAMLSALCQKAEEDGLRTVVEGSNATDDSGDRPGMRAVRELSVLSPLRLCGITKAEIRRNARQAGLSVWDKPSAACLATRIPTGTPISKERLDGVRRGEAVLEQMGFVDFRLRIRDNGGFLQVRRGQHRMAEEALPRIRRELLPEFASVTLDPIPRETREN